MATPLDADALAVALRERAAGVRGAAMSEPAREIFRAQDPAVARVAARAGRRPRAVDEWLPAGAREEALAAALRRFPHLAKKPLDPGRLLDEIAVEAGSLLAADRGNPSGSRHGAVAAVRLAQLAYAAGLPVGALKSLLLHSTETCARLGAGVAPPLELAAATAGEFGTLRVEPRGADPLRTAIARTADALVRGDRVAAKEWATVVDRADRSPLRSGAPVLVALALGKATTIRRALLDLRDALPNLAANRARAGLDAAQFWDFEATGPVAIALHLGHGLEEPGPYLPLP